MEKSEERGKLLASLLIMRADVRRFKTLQDELEPSMNMGRDEYPTTLVSAFRLLVREEPVHNIVTTRAITTLEERMTQMSFAQVGENAPTPGNDGRTHGSTECYNCNKFGHYASNCPVNDTHRSDTSSL